MRALPVALFLLLFPALVLAEGSGAAQRITPPRDAPPRSVQPVHAPTTQTRTSSSVEGVTGSKAELDPAAPDHLGLALHADLGLGFLHTSASGGRSSLGNSRAAATLSFLFGWALAQNWIVGAEAWGGVAPDPSDAGSQSSFELVAVGVNVTHYFMPANVFVSVTPSATRLATVDEDQRELAHSQVGYGMKVTLGKEWVVARNTGIGVAGQVVFSFNRDSGPSPASLATIGGAILFTATFN